MDNQDNDNNDYGLEISPLKLAAGQLHEMYMEFRQAGFTRREALTLVSSVLNNGGNE